MALEHFCSICSFFARQLHFAIYSLLISTVDISFASKNVDDISSTADKFKAKISFLYVSMLSLIAYSSRLHPFFSFY